MSRKNEMRQAVLPDRYRELVEEAVGKLRASVGDYHFKALIVSALDGAINHTWSREDSPVKVTRRDRFPTFGRLTPDFAFEFSNGYLLIGEYKKYWQSGGQDARDLAQLSSYKALTTFVGDKGSQDRRGDVLLLINPGQDEIVCDSIADCPTLGPGSIVVAEASLEGHRMNGDKVMFAYRHFRGVNGKFLPVNAGPLGSQYDLNHHFVEKRGFPAKCDRDALMEAGECPFINDTPPAPYTLINVLLPVLNDKLTEADRDDLAADGAVDVPIRFSEILDAACERYSRVPSDKLRSWINHALRELVTARIASRTGDGNAIQFVFRLESRLERLQPDKVFDKLAKKEVAKRYIRISNATPSGQYVIDFEDPDA